MSYTVIAYGVVFAVFAISLAILRQVIEGYLDQRGTARAERIESPYVAAEALLSAAELAGWPRLLRNLGLQEACSSTEHLFFIASVVSQSEFGRRVDQPE